MPFYRQLTDQIEELIHSGQLSAGDPMPSVRALAKQTLVSLITIRRAYADLAAAGLLVQKQGLGTFVSEQASRVSEARAADEAREVLRGAITRAFQLGLSSSEVLEHIRSVIAATVPKGDS